ncbi:hypothetical protein QF026_002278 [Streptomyces aurantiacus]|uniref:hypothetical protein n=1 Tax=Streptomyces aurantiacus TaxID=47760 RepID=UPI00278D3335|nr:hypothetical protein [Streptomyces aurantiacus]MDQ0773812.1 hypothetical protein [Streptomyces aurantiacus]
MTQLVRPNSYLRHSAVYESSAGRRLVLVLVLADAISDADAMTNTARSETAR